jgi:LTXXQ motif family protein
LKAASSQANEFLKAACPGQIPLTPVGRLDVIGKRLGAMLQAVQIVRGPLEDFYHSLTDEQRRTLDAMETAKPRKIGAKGQGSPGRGLPALCDQRAASFSQLPVERIEQTIQLTKQQRDAFDALKSASATAASELRTSCPSQMPQTIEERLSAVDARLSAMLQAVKTLHPALDAFYALLDDEQKARFNTMGQPWSQASRGE